MSDTPTTPPEEEIHRQIFAETRASTLIPRTPPTSGSETLVPEATPAPEPVPEATLLGETVSESALSDAPTPQSPQPDEPIAPAIAPVPAPIEIETTQPQVTFDQQTAPATQTAPDNALALTFVPAPDAPFQSSVTVGIRSHVAGARIFYTLDGTAPDENSTPYSTEKILLTQSATLNARAYAADKSGPLCSADYIVSKPLWQENEPTDRSDETPHKISANQTAPDGWQLAAASVRGKLHAHRALWREDSFALGSAQNVAGSWSIVVVSDGAGSAPLSRVGSNIACQVALGDLAVSLGEIETLSDDLSADLPRIKAALVGAAKAALGFIRDEATKRNQPINAFAATLLILVRRAVGAAQLCAALQVGDGAIALDCESGLKLLGAADHGQHSSETRFLTTNGMEDDFANRVKFSLPQDLRATLVVSDGVSDDYFPEDKRLFEVFEAVAPLARNTGDAGAAILGWLGYEKKGSSDDRTLVLSWPAEPGAVAALEAELANAPQDSSETRLEEDVSPAPETLTSSPTDITASATDATTSAVAPDAATAPASAEIAATEMRDGT